MLGEPALIKYITADETTVATGTACSVYSVTLLPGTLGLAQVDLKVGGSGGTTKIHLEAALGTTGVSWTTGNSNAGALFDDGIYVNLTGTGAACVVEYTTI